MHKVFALLLCSVSIGLFACGGVDDVPEVDEPGLQEEAAAAIKCGTSTCPSGTKCCLSNLDGDKLACVPLSSTCPQD